MRTFKPSYERGYSFEKQRFAWRLLFIFGRKQIPFVEGLIKKQKGDVDMAEWKKEELSGQYNHAKCPWYSISINGKVDIGKEFGDDEKISLEKDGMLRFVKDWLKETNRNEIKKEQRDELIKLLNE